MNPLNYHYLVITCFDSPLPKAIAAERATRRDNETVTASLGALEFERIYKDRPPRGGLHPIHAVFFEPANARNTTVLLANLEDGWYTLGNCIAIELGCLKAQITTTSQGEEYAIQKLEVWNHGEIQRVVSVLDEGGRWLWDEVGDPLEFEDTSQYARRRIRDRLSREMLFQYMKQLGWDLIDRQFWTSTQDAIYIEEQRDD